MNGHNIQQQIMEYLLGTADAQTHAEISAYIDGGGPASTNCARQAREALSELLELLQPIQPEAEACAALFDRVNGADSEIQSDALRSRQSGRPRHRMIWPASIAAVVALVLVSVLAFVGLRQNIIAQRQLQVAHANRDLTQNNAYSVATDPGNIASMLQAYFDLVPLRGQNHTANSHDRLLVSRHHNLCFVFAPALVSLESDGMYDLRISTGAAEPFIAGRFSVDSTGWSLFPIEMPNDTDFAIARASVVRAESNDQTGPLEELLVGDFPQ